MQTQRNVQDLTDLELAQAVSYNHQLLAQAQNALALLDNEVRQRASKKAVPEGEVPPTPTE